MHYFHRESKSATEGQLNLRIKAKCSLRRERSQKPRKGDRQYSSPEETGRDSPPHSDFSV
jgi:hypothetical protein